MEFGTKIIHNSNRNLVLELIRNDNNYALSVMNGGSFWGFLELTETMFFTIFKLWDSNFDRSNPIQTNTTYIECRTKCEFGIFCQKKKNSLDGVAAGSRRNHITKNPEPHPTEP